LLLEDIVELASRCWVAQHCDHHGTFGGRKKEEPIDIFVVSPRERATMTLHV
jgi:hypothetical protein